MASQDLKKRRRKRGIAEPLPKGFEEETQRLEKESSGWVSTHWGYAKLNEGKTDLRLTSKEEVERIRQRVKNRKAAIARAKKRRTRR